MTDPRESLIPVREALLRQARARAAALLEQAGGDAARTVDDARAKASSILDDARAAGRSEGESAVAAERARARRQARTIVLAARRDAYETLCDQVRSRVRERLSDPECSARLIDLVRMRLGPDAVIERAPCGGVIGRTRVAVLDLSADELAERAVAALGAEVNLLWS